MRPRVLRVLLLALAVIAAAVLALLYREYSRRKAFIHWCNEEGGGGMFTSREYCEELYERSKGKH